MTAFGVMLALAAALVLVSRAEPEGVAATPSSVASTQAVETTASAVTSSVAGESRVLSDAAEALAAWGVFAATGDLDPVFASFAEGPQLDQLLAEAPDRRISGPGLPAFEFEMSNTSIMAVTDDAATVQSSIEMTRPGIDPAQFRWEIELRWDPEDERWRLYTVSTI
jgi:hypothetical protein